jgi:outer membrane cobalamin receptor
MKTQEIAVANKSEINVKMTEESSNLDEVVVTGYQDIRRDRVTGSVTVITAKEIENNSFKSIP